MGAEEICQACHAPLSANAPEGLCPKCLLGLALDAQELKPLAPLYPNIFASCKEIPPLGFRTSDFGFLSAFGPRISDFRFRRPASLAPNPLPDPAVLAQYFPQLEILELLGQGGMGAVYQGPPAAPRPLGRAEDPARQGSRNDRVLPNASPAKPAPWPA